MANITDLLTERQKTHGSFEQHADTAVHLKSIIRNTLIHNGHVLMNYQQEALDMICHKIARILVGNPNYIDHWDDIAGYATLVSQILQNERVS